MQIKKHFDTITAAERYQNRLYNLYDSVILTGFPGFTDYGWYIWTVKTKN
jgi:hypothetical protein